ncbi:hypothetical protein ACIA5H_37310, partial [Nocardia sp. NPDC051900]|uniref:hypothetical protein n=1 Tax=Nocardia sp. NPDC051900 TaxID=3364326 RepID=UPI0037A9BC70
MSECRNPHCRRSCNEFLCSECAEQLVDALDRVPWLLEELAVTELRQDRVSRGLRTGRAPRSPLLFDPKSSDLRRALANSVTTWARHIAETRGVRLRASEDAAAAEWLAEHITAVRLDEAAGELHRDITRAVAAALALINARPR